MCLPGAGTYAGAGLENIYTLLGVQMIGLINSVTNNDSLLIGQIRRDGNTQLRVKLDAATVAEYAILAESGIACGEWPFKDPIVVFRDGAGDHWLGDGFHRVAAWERASAKSTGDPVPMLARVEEGDRRSAILYAAGANADHGLRRSKGDKRRSVEILLSDPEWAQWSDRQIARACNVSPSFVGNVRRATDPDRGSVVTYVNGAGGVSQMDTTKIAQAAHDRAQPKPAPKPDPVVAAPVYVDDPIYVDIEDDQIVTSGGPPAPASPVYVDADPGGGFVEVDPVSVFGDRPALADALNLVLDLLEDTDPETAPSYLAIPLKHAIDNLLDRILVRSSVHLDSDPALPASLDAGIWGNGCREERARIEEAGGNYIIPEIRSAAVAAWLYKEENDQTLRALLFARYNELIGGFYGR